MTARPSDCITVGREDAVSPDRTGQKVLTSESKLAAQSCTQWRHTQAEPFHKPVGSLSSPLQQQILPPPAVTQYTAFVVIPNSMLPGLGLSTPSRYLARTSKLLFITIIMLPGYTHQLSNLQRARKNTFVI